MRLALHTGLPSVPARKGHVKSGSVHRAFSATALVLLTCSSAYADCIGGTRERTPEEIKFGEQVASHLLAVFPAAPPNMWLPKAPEVRVIKGACADEPIGVGAGARLYAQYEYRMPADEVARVKAQREALLERIRALNALPPALKAEVDDLNARYFEAVREAKSAERAGNAALANRKYGEASDFDRKGKEIQLRHTAAAKLQLDPLHKEEAALPPARVRMSVYIAANQPNLNGNGVHEIAYVAGDKDRQARSMPLRVHSVQLVMDDPMGGQGLGASRPRFDTLLAAIDRSRLEALVKQPLPAEAAPVAWRVSGEPPASMVSASNASGQAVGQAAAASSPNPTASPPAPPTSGKPPQQSAQQPAPPPAKPAESVADKAKEAVNKLRGVLKF
jgi:hypothetical protein